MNGEGKENLMGLFLLATLYRPERWRTLSSFGNLFSLPFTALHLESCQCTVYFQQDHWSVSDVWSLSKSGVLVVVPAPAVSILYTRNANVTSLSSSRDQPTHLRTRSSIKSCFIGYRFRSHFSPRYGSSYFYFNYQQRSQVSKELWMIGSLYYFLWYDPCLNVSLLTVKI